MRLLRLLIFLSIFLFSAKPVFAHGFGQQFTLPLPLWLYLFSAGVVVVASFVLLSVLASKKEDIKAVGTLPPLPVWLTNFFRAAFLFLFLLLLSAGLFGNQFAGDNLAPIFFWIIWTVGVFFLVSLVGNLWRYLNPWESLFLLFKWLLPNYKPPFQLPKLALWPTFIFLVIYLWVENVSALYQPWQISTLLASYTIFTLGAALAYGEVWFESGEVFNVLYRILSTFAPLKFGQKETQVYIPSIRLTNEIRRDTSLVAFVLFMLSGVTFDGVKENTTYFAIRQFFSSEINLNLGDKQYNTLAMFVLFFLFVAIYYFFNFLVSATTHLSLKKATLYFITSLIPIAIGYELAHFSSLLLVQGQDIVRVASDPFAFGWDLLGTRGFKPILFINAKFFWYLQIVTIITGHIAGVYVAHKVSLAYLDRKKAFLSQLPMLGLMIFFTVFSLWVISQPVVVNP